MATQAVPAKRKRMNKGLQEGLIAYAFIAPYLISIAVFTLGAMLYALYVSFTDLKLFNTPQFVGLTQYERVLTNSDVHKALGNTLLFSFVVVFEQTWLAILMAVALNAKIRGLRFFRVAWYTPSVTASVVISLIFFWLYFRQGYINYILVSLFGWLGYEPIAWLNSTTWSLPAIMTLNIFTTVPTFMLMFLAALQDIPKDLYEAASIDGATGPRVFFGITLPLLRPIVFLVVVLGTIGTLQVFDQIYVMTDGGPQKSTLTVAFLIFREAFRDSNMAFASAIAFVLFIIIFVLFLIQRRFLEKGAEV
ncbi:MAG TPA: sugar ABC transporter permease [Chloroflexia bacterium]|nr:sugar ABC transporter permease [Chloroflexia bacterium]